TRLVRIFGFRRKNGDGFRAADGHRSTDALWRLYRTGGFYLLLWRWRLLFMKFGCDLRNWRRFGDRNVFRRRSRLIFGLQHRLNRRRRDLGQIDRGRFAFNSGNQDRASLQGYGGAESNPKLPAGRRCVEKWSGHNY